MRVCVAFKCPSKAVADSNMERHGCSVLLSYRLPPAAAAAAAAWIFHYVTNGADHDHDLYGLV